jgi:Fe-S oxidoreductase/FAD/FMN-containing dehydrogenase
MQDNLKKDLIAAFDERVAFHKTERLLYSTDIGFLPAVATMQINTMPDAVVQPRTTDELKKLIDLAAKYNVPLVPRGGGTTGYGGVVPTRGGIVVDFTRMNKVIAVDEAARTATVEPGVRWNDLENKLHEHKLSLRLYPGSAISATVGGWIAGGGGVGIGSYEYGYLADNIISIELVTPGGVRVLEGKEISLVDGLAGTTGFISGVTMKVRDFDKDVPVMAAFNTLADLTALFNKLSNEKLEIWEAGFRNPLHASLSIKAEKKQDDQFIIHADSAKHGFPENKFLALFVYPQGREARVRGLLLKLIADNQGEVLPDDVAQRDWDDRFYPLRLKALGPSIIPSEVDIKAGNLPEFFVEIQKSMHGLAYNGTLVNHGERSTVLMYMLGDERAPGFTLGYANGFVPLKAAANLDGRPYAIGMYLADSAEGYFGKEKLHDIFKFKQQVDPASIMNPGKVFPGSMDKTAPSRLRFLLKLAGSMGGIIGLAYRVIGSKSPARFAGRNNTLSKLPFGKQAVWDAFACVRCGYCSSVCTEYKAIGWESASPRGKFHFLREYVDGHVKFDERMGELFYACTTCGHCNELCQIKSHIEEHWSLTGRAAAWADGYNPPQVTQIGASHALLRHNPSGMSQEKRTSWKAPGLKLAEEGEIGYWVGCNASINTETRNLPVNSVRILNKAGIEPVYLAGNEWCCGGGVFAAGCVEEYEETLRHNLDELHKRGVKTLLTSCGSCYYYLGHLYPILAQRYGIEYGIKVKHMSEYIDELIQQGKLKPKFPLKFSITYHDPCHQACAGHIFKQPRNVLAAIPELKLVEMEHHGEDTACCGRHTSRYPHFGGILSSGRIQEALDTGVPALVTSCPTCETNFRNALKSSGKQIEIFDITDLVAESLGLPTLVSAKLKKVMKGPGEAAGNPEPVQIYLSEEELVKENNMFSPHQETYGELHARSGSVKTISEELGESSDNTKVPKSC